MTIHTPSPRRDSTRTALIIGIALAAVLLLGVGITALLLGLSGASGDQDDQDDDTTSSQTPEAALEEFVQATNAGDCEVLTTHPITDLDTVEDCEDTLDDARETAEDEGYDYESFALEIDDLEVVDQDDRDATVSVDVTQSYDLDGESETYEDTYVYELEKDGDRWLVVDLTSEVSDPDGA